MKFYSDYLKTFFDTEKECLDAEAAYEKELKIKEEEKKKAAAERKARAEEIEKVRDEYLEAREKYNSLLNDFCRDYGSYHYSVKGPEAVNSFLNSFFSLI